MVLFEVRARPFVRVNRLTVIITPFSIVVIAIRARCAGEDTGGHAETGSSRGEQGYGFGVEAGVNGCIGITRISHNFSPCF